MNSPKSVAAVLLSSERKEVLLIKRRDVPVWVLPGGGIDPGELPERAIEREVLEETGFTVKVARLVGDYLPINRLSKRTHLYECIPLLHRAPYPSPGGKDMERGIGKLAPNKETLAVAFFSIYQLPPMPPPYLEWIQDALLNATPVQKKLLSISYKNLIKNLILHPILVLRFLLARIGCAINSN